MIIKSKDKTKTLEFKGFGLVLWKIGLFNKDSLHMRRLHPGFWIFMLVALVVWMITYLIVGPIKCIWKYFKDESVYTLKKFICDAKKNSVKW